jgi:hypothetical protein
MNERRKLWMGLSAALMVGTTSAHSALPVEKGTPDSSQALQLAALGGEGEGAEASVDLRTDDVSYLGQLGLVRGHLWVGLQLYRHDHREMARTHMKHPGDELYSSLVPAMQARDVPAFAEALSALSDSVNADAPLATVEEKHAALSDAIAEAEQLDQAALKTVLLSIAYMTRTAAEEYALGVQMGDVVNHHEYQDSYGFTEVARQRLDRLTPDQRAAGPEAIAAVREQLQQIDSLWPELVPEARLNGDASVLYGASARIEIAAGSL